MQQILLVKNALTPEYFNNIYSVDNHHDLWLKLNLLLSKNFY